MSALPRPGDVRTGTRPPARTATLFPDADPGELQHLAVEAALAALDAGQP